MMISKDHSRVQSYESRGLESPSVEGSDVADRPDVGNRGPIGRHSERPQGDPDEI